MCGVPAKKRKKNEPEEDFLEMVENLENPLRCPVRLYEFYLSKWWVSVLGECLTHLLSLVFLPPFITLQSFSSD